MQKRGADKNRPWASRCPFARATGRIRCRIIVMLVITAEDDGVVLGVKVVPGASRTRYLGPWQELARIAVAAPPEKGKANQALIKYLADLLDIPKRNIEVVRGQSSPVKKIRIGQVNTAAVRAAFDSIDPENR